MAAAVAAAAGGTECRGTTGGFGGAGGGALLLRAKRFIEVRGAIDVRGEAGLPAEVLACGGDRVDSAGGEGGEGGSGSGGLVYFEAPTVVFSEGAVIDLTGGGLAGSGLVAIAGTVEGLFPAPKGATPDRICRFE
ncbi:MAG: hypothetical protein H6701_00780 [Myxococcales bacterium]|nr:hypothetical protein [Myxococcales bacterium]